MSGVIDGCRPDNLADVYLKAYKKLRKHITLPNYLRFVTLLTLH